jgi:phage regulator Rha-like protein
MMLDEHLAELYGVETKALKRAVRRNRDRFPADFMFELRAQEYAALRRQFGTLKRGQHAKYLPYAFTEQGVAMLSSVLRSKRAVLVNVEIMRAFVRLREILATHRQLAGKLAELERRMATHDEQIQAIFEAIRQLLNAPEPPRGRIGFQARDPRTRYRIRAKRAHR